MRKVGKEEGKARGSIRLQLVNRISELGSPVICFGGTEIEGEAGRSLMWRFGSDVY